MIRGSVENSVLYTGCLVEEGAIVRGTVLMPNTVVKSGAIVDHAIIGESCVIEGGARIGSRPEDCAEGEHGIAVVGHRKTISSDAVIQPKAIV